jgi:hypothetical protein
VASFADQLIQGVQQTTRDQGNDLQEAAGLATKVQQIKENRTKLDQAKKNVLYAKIAKFATAYGKGVNITDPKTQKAYMTKFIPSMRDALNLQEQFPDETLEFIGSSQENMGRFTTLVAEVTAGTKSVAEVVEIMGNPEKLIAQTPTTQKQLLQAARTAAAVEGREASLDQRKIQEATDIKQFRTKQVIGFKTRLDSKQAPDRKRLDAANNAIELLRIDGPIASEVAKTQMARLAGEVGNLTEQDIERFGGSKDLLSRINQFREKHESGKLTKSNKKQLEQITREFRKIIVTKMIATARDDAKAAASLGLGDEEEIFNTIKPTITGGKKKKKTSGLLRSLIAAKKAGNTREIVESKLKEQRKNLSDEDRNALLKEAGF